MSVYVFLFLCVCEEGNLSLGGHDSYSSIVDGGVQTRRLHTHAEARTIF